MPENFFPEIYASWQKKQLQKYQQLLPLLKKHLKQNSSLLDIGIGKAWLEGFLQKHGFSFSKIVGVDALEERVSPKKQGIEYVFSKNFSTQEKFDFVLCFDSAHLLRNKKIQCFAKTGGLVLLSVPLSQKHRAPILERAVLLEEGIIGLDEKSFFQLLRAI